jgi:hypothetical protein
LSGYFYMYLLVVADQTEWYSDETNQSIANVELYMEIFFLLHLVKNFITDYYPEGSKIPERRLPMIINKNLNSDFLLDFITLIPITYFYLKMNPTFIKPFYMIKCLRFKKGYQCIDVQRLTKPL